MIVNERYITGHGYAGLEKVGTDRSLLMAALSGRCGRRENKQPLEIKHFPEKRQIDVLTALKQRRQFCMREGDAMLHDEGLIQDRRVSLVFVWLLML